MNRGLDNPVLDEAAASGRFIAAMTGFVVAGTRP